MNTETASYYELTDFIKSKRNTEEGRDFFGNYTQKTKEDLRDLVSEWKDNHKSTPRKAKETKETEEQIEYSSTENEKLSKVLHLLTEATDLVKQVPGVEDLAEYEKLKEQATAIEFELQTA